MRGVTREAFICSRQWGFIVSIGTKTVPTKKLGICANKQCVSWHTNETTYVRDCVRQFHAIHDKLYSSCVHLLLLQTPDTSCDEDQVRMWVHRSPGIVHLETMSAVKSKADEACNNQGEKIHAVSSSYIIFSCTSRTVDNTPSLYTPLHTRAWFEGGILGWGQMWRETGCTFL